MSPNNKLNHNTTQTHFKLTLNKVIYIYRNINQKFVPDITHTLHLLMLTSPSSSTPNSSSTLAYPHLNQMLDGLSSVRACCSTFVHIHCAHIHCHFHCVCKYGIFIIATATHLVTAAPCHPGFSFCASSTFTSRWCCYFEPFTTFHRSSSTNS